VHLDQLLHQAPGEGIVTADDEVRLGLRYPRVAHRVAADPAPGGGDEPRRTVPQASEALGHGQILSAPGHGLMSADQERFAPLAR
jgi:hypothetical protein